MAAVLGGAPHIRNRTSCYLSRQSCSVDRFLAHLLILQGRRPILHQQRGRRNGPQSNTSSLELPIVVAQLKRHTAAHHSNIHLVARDKPEIMGSKPYWCGGNEERNQHLI